MSNEETKVASHLNDETLHQGADVGAAFDQEQTKLQIIGKETPAAPENEAAEKRIPAQSVENIAAKKRIPAQSVLFFSCNGGAGATMLSVSMAAYLARLGQSTCLVDLDLQLGDVFVALDMTPTTSIGSLLKDETLFGESLIKRRMDHHSSGIYALTQTAHVTDIDDSFVDKLTGLVIRLSDVFDHVIIDGVRDFSDCAIATLDVTSQVVLVVTPDVISIRRAARVITLFTQLGYNADRLCLVINRMTNNPQIHVHEIEQALSLRIEGIIPENSKQVQTAFTEGNPLCSTSEATLLEESIEEMAQRITIKEEYGNDASLMTPPQSGSLLGRLFGK